MSGFWSSNPRPSAPPLPAGFTPATFSDVVAATWSDVGYTEASDSAMRGLVPSYVSTLDRLAQLTGRSELAGSPVYRRMRPDLVGVPIVEALEKMMVDNEPTIKALGDPQLRTRGEILDEMRREAERRAELSAHTRARASSLAGGAGSFVGTAARLAFDPVNLLGMAVAPGTVAGSALRKVAYQGLVNMGTELAIQPDVADLKAKLGIPWSAAEKAFNVLAAGVAGMAFEGARLGLRSTYFHLAKKGHLDEKPVLRHALEDVVTNDEVLAANPMPDHPGSAFAHQELLNEAQVALANDGAEFFDDLPTRLNQQLDVDEGMAPPMGEAAEVAGVAGKSVALTEAEEALAAARRAVDDLGPAPTRPPPASRAFRDQKGRRVSREAMPADFLERYDAQTKAYRDYDRAWKKARKLELAAEERLEVARAGEIGRAAAIPSRSVKQTALEAITARRQEIGREIDLLTRKREKVARTLVAEVQARGGIRSSSLKADYDWRTDLKESGLWRIARKNPSAMDLSEMAEELARTGDVPQGTTGDDLMAMLKEGRTTAASLDRQGEIDYEIEGFRYETEHLDALERIARREPGVSLDEAEAKLAEWNPYDRRPPLLPVEPEQVRPVAEGEWDLPETDATLRNSLLELDDADEAAQIGTGLKDEEGLEATQHVKAKMADLDDEESALRAILSCATGGK